ncbi:hypothetical protein AWB74_08270 [Caballeronia arvi]|uniref:Uncharacterized protein n=1 Tax=Caballeronia arvi TaxID=1777135 RepID=A0A158L466_9BURK|nr:hypothetical protein [Caballeronia arvi]SAL87799.1 hypothetical protein AWB74_08270 [Caballeronia arvi]
MAQGNWNPEVIKPKPRCRLCRRVVTSADFVRLDGVSPAHRGCAQLRGRAYIEGQAIHGSGFDAHAAQARAVSENTAYVVGERLSDRLDEEQAEQALEALNGARKLD